MHQPYYKDDFENKYLLPWVFLHAIKDYYEMPWHISKFDNIKAVFNLVPSLIVQLEDYANGTANDLFLEALTTDVKALSNEEKQKLLPQLFMANVRHMIYPSERYKNLYEKFKSNQDLDDTEINDLEVLFLLSWSGHFIRQNSETVKNLILQDKFFTNEQKAALLNELFSFIKKIIPFYKKLAEENKIELSATPFYHPILPLLLNHLSAKEAKNDIILPRIFNDFSSDAHLQVKNAKKYFTDVFGFSPTGMWPAEGSISNDAAKCFIAHGVNWIASDEDVLSNSLSKNLSDENFRCELYKPYYYENEGKKINLFFRDKKLSDLIGFSYSNIDAEKASSDFINKLKNIYDKCDFEPVVSVILDGENAWEYYFNNAMPFFESLYGKISQEDWIETLTFSEITENTESVKLNNIVAGSWIYGNFTTWVGHPEKNKAWELLSETINDIENKKHKLDENTLNLITKELHIALGSDWFWWYGDDHFSIQADIFDDLFRKHLANIYKLAGVTVNPEIYKPIKKSFKSGIIEHFKCPVNPKIDGQITDFYEWIGSGKFDLKYDLGSMHTDSSYLNKLHWGKNSNILYLRIDGKIKEIFNKNMILDVEFIANIKKNFSVSIDDNKIISFNNFESDEKIKVAIKDIIEMEIPLNEVITNKNKVAVQFRLKKETEIIERAPVYNFAELDLSEEYLKNWIV